MNWRAVIIATCLVFVAGHAMAQSAKRAMPVRTAAAAIMQISNPVEALGTARANETVMLSASVTEKIATIKFGDGDHVRAGDVLVLFDMAEERAQLAAATAALAERQLAFDRAQELNKRKVVSKATLDERDAQLLSAKADIAAINARIADRTLTAPFDGQVGLRQVSAGALVRPGDVITSLDDLSVIKVDFSVPALRLTDIRTGLAIHAASPALPGKTFSGIITSINPQVDPVTRSITVRAQVPNADRHLVPGLLMTIVIETYPRRAVIVPERAIVPRGALSYVYLLGKDGIARQQQVQTGTRLTGHVEITHGVAAGDIVVTDGNHKLRDGAAVQRTDAAN